MSIGDKIVHPFALEDTGCQMDYHLGLTYREWLIGMLASNPEFMIGASPDRMAVLPTKSAEWIIAQADAIIKQLDKESE